MSTTKRSSAAPVVGLREALAVEQPAPLQLGVGVEEAVGGDQRDVGVLGPVRQHLLQHPRGGGLAHRHRPGEPDHERRARRGAPVQEGLLLAVQLAGRADVQAEQPGERQVDLLHLVEVQGVAEAAQPLDLLGRSGLSVSGREGRPGVAVELDVGRDLTLVGAVPPDMVGDSCSSPACRSARSAPTRVEGYVRDRRIRRAEAGPGRRDRRPAPARVPRLRLRRDRRRRRRHRGHQQAGRQAGQPREGDRRPAAARLPHRDRAHPLGHPRAPNDVNAHPHSGGSGRIALVHNGIIENFADAPRPDRGRRPRDGVRDRHRGGLPAARAAGRVGRRPDHRDAAGRHPARGRVHAGGRRRGGPRAGWSRPAATRRSWWASARARTSSAPTCRRSSSTPARRWSWVRTRS